MLCISAEYIYVLNTNVMTIHFANCYVVHTYGTAYIHTVLHQGKADIYELHQGKAETVSY